MTERITEASSRPGARLIGVAYLLYFVTVISAELFIRGLVVPGDAAATASNILTHEFLFRLHFAVGLVATGIYIALTALLYGLFKPVSRRLALTAAFFGLVGCAIQAFGNVFQLAPSVILGGGQYLSVFKAEQLNALALLFLNLNSQAYCVQLVFFGVFDLLIGCLIMRSAFLPRILGVLMALAGLGWLIFLSPPLARHLLLYIEVLGILAEAALMLWLLVMGVNVQRWKEQASSAEEWPS